MNLEVVCCNLKFRKLTKKLKIKKIKKPLSGRATFNPCVFYTRRGLSEKKRKEIIRGRKPLGIKKINE